MSQQNQPQSLSGRMSEAMKSWTPCSSLVEFLFMTPCRGVTPLPSVFDLL